MRFEGLDLNLLVALDALLTEGTVSGAAEKVFLSQSAMSGALARLREYFGDELLAPSGRRMLATPRAQQLAQPVRAALLQIRTTITSRPEFEPSETRKDFSIIASDYATVVALSEGLRRIKALAPHMTFRIAGVDSHAADRLERGDIDLLITLEQFISRNHPSEPLFDDDYVVIAWRDGEMTGATLDAEDYFSRGHVIVDIGPRTPVFDAWYLESGQRIRRVEVTAPNFTLAPYLVIGTDRIATMHRRLAMLFAAFLPLKIYPAPFEIPKIRQAIQWHRLQEADAATLWVKDRLVDVFRPSEPTSSRPDPGADETVAKTEPRP